MIKAGLSTLLLLLVPLLTMAQTQVVEGDIGNDELRVEYFFDIDPGYGLGTTLSSPSIGTDTYVLDLNGITPGAHVLYLRVQDAQSNWSFVQSRPLYVLAPVNGEVAAVEYFFDIDPGYGLGTILSSPSIGTNTYVLDLNGITPGAHVLYLRAQDAQSNWSFVQSRPLYVLAPVNGEVAAVEYFFDDNDPGNGNATAVMLPENFGGQFSFEIPTMNLSVGDHQLNVRAKDNSGQWSILSSEPFSVMQSEEGIIAVESQMSVDIKIKDSQLVLTDCENIRKGNAVVELYSISGMNLHTAKWPQTQPRLNLPLNVLHSSVILVKITDEKTGRYLLRRLLY